MTILIIEPDKILGRTYSEALKQDGHDVFRSRHAQDAVHVIEDKKPDLIILELQLPGHGGMEFLYEFRSYPEWQNISVVLHTIVPANVLQAQMPHLAHLGVAGYLYKPTTNLQQLKSAVNDMLQTA